MNKVSLTYSDRSTLLLQAQDHWHESCLWDRVQQIVTYGILGLLAGWATYVLMPEGINSSRWVATLLGLAGSLAGTYASRSILSQPGEGTTLFLSLLTTFVMLSGYRIAYRRLSEVRKRHACTAD